MSDVGTGATDVLLTEHGTIVTASRRLARRLREGAANRAVAAGLEVWATPDILPWASWTKRLWRGSGVEQTTMRLLQSEQALALWSERVAHHRSFMQSRDVSRAAPALYESWQRFCEWGLTPHDLTTAALNSDQAVFAQLVQEFARFLEQQNWLDPVQLNSALCRVGLPFDEISPPVRLLGFLELTRTQQNLIAAIAAQGVAVHVEKYDSQLPDAVHRVLCDDHDQELLSAGAWARAELGEDPGARIAIVAPGLAGMADRKAGLVKETLVPGWQLSPAVGCLNVSYGRMLNEYPLIAAQVALVDALLNPMGFDQLSTVLRNPVLGENRSGDLARLELAVRELSEQVWSPNALIGVAGELGLGDDCLRWLSEVRAAAETLRDWRQMNTPDHWAREIDQIVSRFGQFQNEVPDSEEYQLRNAWRETLNELAGLTVVLPRRRGTDAWSWVKGRLKTTVFQPETTGFAVELMGPLEAIGLEFDGVWFAGLDAASWPLQRSADPIIPLALQKAHGMPGADPHDTLQFSSRVLSSILVAAEQSIVSSAHNDEDVDLQPSPSIAAVSLLDSPVGHNESVGRFAATLSRQTPALVSSYDRPLPVSADEEIRGGYGVLATQRELPLAAFAQFRLGARPIEPAVAGIGARARGILIHRALEALLPAGKTRDSLTSAAALVDSDAIQAAVRQAARSLWRRPDALLRALIGREERRCAALLAGFVETERARPDFSILDAEREVQFELGDLQLHLRIDRIDQTSDGVLIIDYKTGRQRQSVVRSDNSLRELQLGAYVMALDQLDEKIVPEGLAVARIHSVSPGYNGVWFGAEKAGFGSFKAFDESSGQLELWYQDLAALAADFCRGAASLPLDLKPADLRPWQMLSYGFTEAPDD